LPLVLSIIAGIICLLFAFYIKTGGASRIFSAKKDPNIEKATEFYSTGKKVQLEAYIDRYQKQIVKSKNLKDWLPYIRMVAFSRDGQFEGVKPSALRGVFPWVTPNDCSAASWKSRWEKSKTEWISLIDGKDIPHKDWSKILLWDPYWILRRSTHPEWVEPSGYYEACLKMAVQGLSMVEISQTDSALTEQRNIFLARLNWLISMFKGAPVQGEFQMSGVLWALSCIESSEDSSNGNECLQNADWEEPWNRLLRMRLNWRGASLLLMNKKVIKSPGFDEFKSIAEKLNTTDASSGFDYGPEQRYYQQIIITGGNISTAIGEMKERLIGINFENFP
jgi:hypothetical protein